MHAYTVQVNDLLGKSRVPDPNPSILKAKESNVRIFLGLFITWFYINFSLIAVINVPFSILWQWTYHVLLFLVGIYFLAYGM